jgi:hypothetical protein
MEQYVNLKLYFSDYFEVPKKSLDTYGAFDISLVADLPLFIDPFLLFQSKNTEYRAQHLLILRYLEYLRDESISHAMPPGRLKSLFYFSEVKQNYLGFTYMGNSGRGLGDKFAHSLNTNLSRLFTSFGKETITQSSHLEKLCLISKGVGRDTISDFVTNLIKEFLLRYTQEFTIKNIRDEFKTRVTVPRVRFNYDLGIWTHESFILPIYQNDFVLLTPKDILTREDTWISRSEYISDFFTIIHTTQNEQLQADLDQYLKRVLSKTPNNEELQNAIQEFTRLHPELIDYFIRSKEDNGEKAVERSIKYVQESEQFFITQFGNFAQFLWNRTLFYRKGFNTKKETYERIMYLKDAIENQGCWKIFYNQEKPITREEDIHILFRLVWFGTAMDVSREVNDGQGPVDYKISYGKQDKTLVEFKLASNSHLRDNLQNQLEAYKKASDTEQGYKVIFYFSDRDLLRVQEILTELKMSDNPDIILVDARPKKSASLLK